MIAVRPDPAHPHGGFALLEVAGGGLAEETASVEVFDSFAGRYLGPSGWQATRFAFGPYPVERAAEGDRLRIGPEIVNQLTEYQPVRLQLGAVQADLSWPDDVVPDAAAAVSGGIWTAPADPRPGPKPVSALKAPVESTPAPETTTGTGAGTGTQAPTGGDQVKADPGAAPPGKRPLLLAGLAALVLIGAGLAYFLAGAPEQEAAAPPPPPAEDACAMPALTALAPQGFAAVAAQLRQCAGAVSPDDALSLLETAARANDPAALALFGQIYDADATDAGLETGLGLTFSDNPARAAEYYDRAVQAGSQEAQPLRDKVCRRLLLMNDTLSQSAHEDHCGS